MCVCVLCVYIHVRVLFLEVGFKRNQAENQNLGVRALDTQEEVDEKVFPCLKKWRGASAQLAHDVLLRLVIRLLHSGHGLETTERVSDWAATALAHDVQETEEGLFDDLQLKHIGQAIRFAKDCVQTEPSGGQASAMATTT